jgi:hypothetical protein
MTPLPATHCSRCGAHLGTGFVPVDEETSAAARRKKQIRVGLAACLVLGGLLLIFIFFKAEPPAPAVPAGGPSSAPEAAAEVLQNIPPGPAVGVRPDIIINRTKDVAGQVEENQKRLTQERPD